MRIVLIAVLFIINNAFAQGETENLMESESVQETLNSVEEVFQEPYPSERLEEKWSDRLSGKGKTLGVLNSDGSLYIITSASVVRASDDPGFIDSRIIAYEKAELNAKMEIARMMNEQLTSSRSAEIMEDLQSGEDPDAKKTASKLDKASKIIDKSLDKALSYLGVSEDEIAGMNEKQKKAQAQESFSSMQKSLSAAMIKGCAVVGAAEGESGKGYEMVVVMKYSPELRKLSSLFSRGKSSPPKGKSKNSIEKLKSLTVEQLVTTLGAKVMWNQEGNRIIVGFGQDGYETGGRRESQKMKNAQSRARLNAVTAIKNFVAEDMVVSETQEKAEKLTEYADGDENIFSAKKWEQSIRSKSTTVDVSGTNVLRKWRGKHPGTGHAVAGVIVVWSYKNRQVAKQMVEDSKFDDTDERVEQKSKKVKEKTKSYIESDWDDDDDW